MPRPTRPSDVLHVDSEIVEIVPSRAHPGGGTVVARGETRYQRSEVVQITTVKLIVAAPSGCAPEGPNVDF
jgi:acyl dehydratase